MNRCIQCTRCIRFTEEISAPASWASSSAARAPRSASSRARCSTTICRPASSTSVRSGADLVEFRFAERVWYLDKKPSICTGCDVGCNITLEHRAAPSSAQAALQRRGQRLLDVRLRSRHLPRWQDGARLATPGVRQTNGSSRAVPRAGRRPSAGFSRRSRDPRPRGHRLRGLRAGDDRGGLPAGPHGAAAARHIVRLRALRPEADDTDDPRRRRRQRCEPNRRGALLGGLEPLPRRPADSPAPRWRPALGSTALSARPDFADARGRTRSARAFAAPISWSSRPGSDSPLAAIADVVLPLATSGREDRHLGQRAESHAALRSRVSRSGQRAPASTILVDLLWRHGHRLEARGVDEVFDLMARAAALHGLASRTLPADGALSSGRRCGDDSGASEEE